MPSQKNAKQPDKKVEKVSRKRKPGNIPPVNIIKSYAKTSGREKNKNEDYFVFSDNLYIIADGGASESHGEKASRIACEKIAYSFRKLVSEKKSVEQALNEALREAHQEIINTSTRESSLMDSAVSVLHISGNTAFFANIGNSSIYLVRGKKIRLITKGSDKKKKGKPSNKNYKYGEDQVESLGKGNPDLGVKKMKVQKNDIFILATDGFSSAIPEEELLKNTLKIKEGGDGLEEFCANSLATAKEKKSNENMTVGIVAIESIANKGSGKRITGFFFFLCVIAIGVMLYANANFTRKSPPVFPDTPLFQQEEAVPYNFEDFLNDWKKAWESMDIERYDRFYSEDFVAQGMDKQEWLDNKRRINALKDWISIEIDQVNVEKTNDKATIHFVMDYSSSNYSSVSIKTLHLVYSNQEWLIKGELSDVLKSERPGSQ